MLVQKVTYALQGQRTLTALSFLRLLATVCSLAPLLAILCREPDTHRSEHHENGADGAEPSNSYAIDDWQTRSAASCCERITNHVIAGDNFSAAALHHVQAVGVEGREAH